MKIAMRVLGVILMIVGVIWILQGVNILPGSFMTGHVIWAVYGGLAAAAGIGLLALSRRR